MLRNLICVLLLASVCSKLNAQCCSAGSGSPVAGGTSQGVLAKGQAEINFNHQYISTRKFMDGDKLAKDFLDRFSSHYSYLRVAYGLSKEFTISVESGYYLSKSQVDLAGKEISSSGISDLIIFPRYSLLNKNTAHCNTELTVGLGWKIPVGLNNINVEEIEPFSGEKFHYRAPPAIQPTTGSHDFIFYSFLYKSYPSSKLKLFASGLYVKKGWNSMGEKFGDYASLGLFAGRSFGKKLSVLFQLKGEWIDKLHYNKDVYDAGKLNYDVEATGTRKLLAVPQLNYSFTRQLTIYGLSEFPLYQYVNKIQIASQYLVTMGISYRFRAMDCESAAP